MYSGARRDYIHRLCINDPLTHYCIVRADVPFGAQAAQLIHAAGHSALFDMPDGTYAIALRAADEASLRALAARLAAEGVPHHLVVESDPPYAGQAMAIGVTPAPRSRLKKILSSYALVAQSGRASGVMTRKAPGSNPGGRATDPAPS